MKTAYSLFASNTASAPEGLREAVWARIAHAMRAQARRRQFLFGTFALVSVAALAVSAASAVGALRTSGFGSYFSLIFSDGAAVASLWKQFLLSLVEVLPVASIGLILASTALAVWSARRFFRASDTFSSTPVTA